MDIEEIKSLIAEGLPGARVEMDGDGRHFSAIVISELFSGKSMVKQHQLVYSTLGAKMGVEIHALSIKTYTPEQWNERQDLRVI